MLNKESKAGKNIKKTGKFCRKIKNGKNSIAPFLFFYYNKTTV